MRRFILFGMVIIISSCFSLLYSQFPVGLFSGAQYNSTSTVASDIRSLNANMLLHNLPSGSAINSISSSQYNYLIPVNAYSDTEKVHYYSGGYLRTWKPKEEIIFSASGESWNDTIGIKKRFGSLQYDSYASENVAYSGTGTSNIKNFLIEGPKYKQDYRYSTNQRGYNVNTEDPQKLNIINYIASFNLRKGTAAIAPGVTSSDTICIVSVWIGDTQIDSAAVIDSRLSSSGYDTIQVHYNYDSKINWPASSSGAYNGPAALYNANDITEEYALVQFKVRWLGHRDIFVKDITVYDEILGIQLYKYSKGEQNLAYTRITEYCNNTFSSSPSITNWYSLDEPSTIDSYEPYRLVNQIITSSSITNSNIRKPLITAFSPYFATNQTFVGSYTFPLFLKLARPEILMFDFYPINKEIKDGTPGEVVGQYNVLRNLLADAHSLTDSSTANPKTKFYYVAQAHSYTSSGSDASANLTKPTLEQFTAPPLLALAFGAKGLVFYNYKTTANGSGLETSTDLASAFSSLAERLNGTLGNKLTNLRYKNVYLRAHYIVDSSYNLSSYAPESPISISVVQNSSPISFHCGVLTDPAEARSRYLFLVNETPTAGGQRTTTINIYVPGVNFIAGDGSTTYSAPYTNISLLDVENNSYKTVASGKSETITLDNGQGRLYKAGPAVLIGGTIKNNETISSTGESLKGELSVVSGATLTISGTYNIYNNITVNSGGYLVVSPGATLNFYNGAGLIINGSLTASGTSSQRITFDFKTNSNGIFIYSGGTASISYSNISNAYYGVRCQGNLTSFSNNYVTNNTTGLFVENTSISQVSNNTISGNSSNGISAFNSEFSVSNNYIRDNGNIGVYGYDGSSVTIQNNSITGNSQYGIFVNYYSEAFISYSSGYQNLITGNRYGVYTNWNSTSYLNYNCLYNNNKNSTPSSPGYEVILTRSSIVEAQQNWWGDTLVNPNRIYIGTGTTINYSNPLNATLCNGMSKAIATGSSGEQEANSDINKFGAGMPGVSVQTDKELDSAAHLKYEKKYDQAMAIYDKIISKEVNANKVIIALTGMSNCYKESKKTGFIDYLAHSVRSKYSEKDIIYAVSLELENNWLLAEKRYKDILSNLTKLKIKYTENQEIIKGAIFKTGYIYLTFLKDTISAKAEFELLASKYPDDELVYMSMEIMGLLKNFVGKSNEGNLKIKSQKNITPSDFLLEQNYPNPFNPVTTINYSLPVDSKVKLVVYNSLGQEVALLVDNVKTAGMHNAIFNAAHLSSGVYFYSLTAQPTDGSRKDYQSNKKMLLVK